MPAHLAVDAEELVAGLAVELNLYPGESHIGGLRNRQRLKTARHRRYPSLRDSKKGRRRHRRLTAPHRQDRVKFDVVPKDGKIYVDGFYAGLVNDFNGWQHLQLTPGRRYPALRMTGYESIEGGRVDRVRANDHRRF